MIRKFQHTDIEQVAAIWLDTNISAHDFIPAKYWQDNFEMVKGMLLQSELYVYVDEKSGSISGFVGMDDDYIAGIFVRSEVQSRGIGKQLLYYVKGIKPRLHLRVYAKNHRAMEFYQREGFVTGSEGMDQDTGEKEYVMVWNREIL